MSVTEVESENGGYQSFEIVIEISQKDVTGFLVVTAIEPFRFDELATQAENDAYAFGSEEVYGRPLLLDFRSVDLLRFGAVDFHRVLDRRLAFDRGHRVVPCAMVAADEANFGMLRMYTSLAETRGLRDDFSTFMTMDFDAARVWIARASKRYFRHAQRSSG